MKSRISLQALLLVAAIAVIVAADVSGKWQAEFKTADGQTGQNVFTFKADGEKLTGTVYSSLAGSDAKIDDGSIKGDEIAFAITRNLGGGDVKFRYRGKVAGDEIKFEVTLGEGADAVKFEMTAKREK